MRIPARALSGLLLVLLAGCQREPAPIPTAGPAIPAAPATQEAAPPEPAAASEREALAAKIAEYSRAHPWGEGTGTARLTGTVTWAEGSEPAVPQPRKAMVLKGIPGTQSADLFYRVRANIEGEYEFDRVKAGEFVLKDAEGHWRLRVAIAEGERKSLDLTPDNSVRVRDDFPPTSEPKTGG